MPSARWTRPLGSRASASSALRSRLSRNQPFRLEVVVMGRLENKVAVITGAASGMGRATAIRFAGEGAAVVIADLNQEGGEAAVRECRENGGRAVFYKTDVTSEAEIKSAVESAV